MYYTCSWLCILAQLILNILKANIPFLKEFINDRLYRIKNNHRIYIAQKFTEKPPHCIKKNCQYDISFFHFPNILLFSPKFMIFFIILKSTSHHYDEEAYTAHNDVTLKENFVLEVKTYRIFSRERIEIFHGRQISSWSLKQPGCNLHLCFPSFLSGGRPQLLAGLRTAPRERSHSLHI